MKPTFVCAAFLLLLSMGASAQSLWRDVPAGATAAQVSELIPEARPAPAGGSATADGQVLLHIPRYELVDAAFAVTFGFEQDKLQSIVLRSLPDSPEQARAIAQRLTTALRSRYGLEISTRSRQEPLVQGIDRKWSYRRASVHLQVLEGPVVQLRYAAEAGRTSAPL